MRWYPMRERQTSQHEETGWEGMTTEEAEKWVFLMRFGYWPGNKAVRSDRYEQKHEREARERAEREKGIDSSSTQ